MNLTDQSVPKSFAHNLLKLTVQKGGTSDQCCVLNTPDLGSTLQKDCAFSHGTLIDTPLHGNQGKGMEGTKYTAYYTSECCMLSVLNKNGCI